MEFEDGFGVLKLVAYRNRKQKKEDSPVIDRSGADFYGKTDLNEHVNNNFWEAYRLKYKCSS